MDTVLIVDDSSFIVDGLIAFLKKKYRPLAAYGGAECLEILKREKPSVIILDIMMEPMDGWETLSRIKENPETRHIPVLMFSAIKISPEEAGEHRVSIDDCLTKPVSPNKIVEAIEKVLARRDTNRLITERWQAAGIPRERIDEYLSLVTDLEVDLSLCQNMKIQYDLLPAKDRSEDGFQTMVRSIEERVLHERNRIEALAREMNGILENGSGTDKPAGTPATPGQNESPVPDDVADTPPASAALPPSSPSPEEEDPAGEGNPQGEGTSAGSAPAPEMPPLPDPVPDPSGSGPKQEDPPAVPPSDAKTVGIVPQDPFGSGRTDAESKGDPPAAQDAVTPQEASPSQENTPVPVPEPAPEISPAPLPAATAPATPDRRNVIPADPDIPLVRAGSAVSAPTGAGTDIPMPWGLSSERKTGEHAGNPEKRATDPGSSRNEAPAGFFSRVIALVRSFFRKG